MLDLPGVTLCCVDTVHPALALRALRRSIADIRFARALLLTDRMPSTPDIELRAIAPLASRAAYSAFVLKSLAEHIETEHVLLIQWDGYVINPAAWRDEFLACDYLGAKWFWGDPATRVGNGGFSLRSRRLLRALQDPRIELTGAEDETICRSFRPLLEREHGIVFGSETLADAFAFEAAYPLGKPFGFHGLYNFCRVVPPAELAELTGSFTPAIARSPQLLQLGRNCLALGQWQPAVSIFRCILQHTPDHPEAQAGLARAAAGTAAAPPAGRNEPCPCGSGKRYKHCHGAKAAHGAAGTMQEALRLHERGDTQGALRLYQAILAQEPDHPTAQHFVGVIYYQRGDPAAALPLLEHSVTRQPEEPEFHNNLGLALVALDRESEAIAHYRAALALKPEHAVAWNNLGLAHQLHNDVGAAIDAFRQALALQPDFAQARWNLALALLLDGQFAEGWREYEVRLALPELGGSQPPLPGVRWDGREPAGKTLLLATEQGLGDAVQFARYAQLLERAGARCILRCPEALAPLLTTIPGVAEVSVDGAPLPNYAAYLPLLSLPRVLGTTPTTIPASVPYLAVAAAGRAAARTVLEQPGSVRRIGLCWAGNPGHRNDRKRSLPLAALAPLLALPGSSWFSLQAGDAAAQLATTPGAQRVIPLPEGTALVDTAARIAELDLIISVDTAIAHLAGALARPTWLLLPFAPDWRWQLGRDDSPWYPTLRLFRQPRPGDWVAVVERVAAALQDELALHGTTRAP
jgi:tetratricopeptide (TPR) repeat protein